MRFRGGEFSTGTTGNFQSELTISLNAPQREEIPHRDAQEQKCDD